VRHPPPALPGARAMNNPERRAALTATVLKLMGFISSSLNGAAVFKPTIRNRRLLGLGSNSQALRRISPAPYRRDDDGVAARIAIVGSTGVAMLRCCGRRGSPLRCASPAGVPEWSQLQRGPLHTARVSAEKAVYGISSKGPRTGLKRSPKSVPRASLAAVQRCAVAAEREAQRRCAASTRATEPEWQNRMSGVAPKADIPECRTHVLE
jgi:hypothetical protein